MVAHVTELEIEGFTCKGKGLATYRDAQGASWPVEVSRVYPGERIHTQLPKRRRGRYVIWDYQLALPLEERVEPRCKHAARCGGCRWQTLDYPTQLTWKQKQIEQLFEGATVFPIRPCDNPWHYRNKMEYTFASDAKRTKFLGLLVLEGMGRVVNLEECHLTAPWFIHTLSAVRNWWEQSSLEAYHPPKDRGTLRRLTLREALATEDRLVILTTSGNPLYPMPTEEAERFVEEIRRVAEPKEGSLSIILSSQQIAKGTPTRYLNTIAYGKGYLEDRLELDGLPALQLHVSPEAFLQPNKHQLKPLYTLALQLADIGPSDTVFDLCCGTGTLTLSAALKARHALGIDLCEEAIHDARLNARVNHLENVEFIAGDVKQVLLKMERRADVCLVDPPRAGLEDQTLKALSALQPRTIVYISCNPFTQARDVGQLKALGYLLEAVQPIDQFPHTPHIENIAVLKRVAS